MAQSAITLRQYLIIRKLSRFPATYEEIKEYISDLFDDHSLDLHFCKRTFERDIKNIYKIYRITIKNQSDNTYYIEDEFDPKMNERMFEALELYNALNVTEHNRDFIYLEKRHASGLEHLHSLLHAIKNHKEVSFNYFKYGEDEPTKRRVKPLALKEFKYRWYLIARDETDVKDKDKRFALDRISNLEILQLHFEPIEGLDVEQMHAHCFGITVPKDYKVQKVVLSFTPDAGKYIKSLPLHPTQEILIDNEIEFRISLNIYVTHDFIMEILSFGDDVKALEPQSLMDEVKGTLMKAIERYK